MSVNKRLLFGSLAVATSSWSRRRNSGKPRRLGHRLPTTTTHTDLDNDLSPTIGTNAAVAGRQFPAVELQTLAGDSFATADLVETARRQLLVSTCPPCKKELPAFAAAHAEVGDQVRFVGIDSFPPSDHEESFARDKGVRYELLYDPDGELTSERTGKSTASALHSLASIAPPPLRASGSRVRQAPRC